MLLNALKFRHLLCLAGLSLTIAGCSSTGGSAPVESRAPGTRPAASSVQQVSPDTAPAVAKPGYYIVRKGDTLYSIAHQQERDFRELAAWNELGDANVIKVGQELRVTPPDQPLGSRVLAPPPAIETRPLDGGSTTLASKPVTPVVAAPASSAPLAGSKTEPKGGRVPYSPQAWKDLQAGDKPAAPGSAASTPASASVKPEVKPSTSPDSKVAISDDATVDWVWPSAGKVIAGFNDSSNKGVDIAGNIGDPVLAAGAGRVVYVGTGVRGYGNLVIVKHNNSNFISAYAHNSEVFVKEGQTVQKGQKIAALGNSDADRAKLHFEIRRQGRPVDPLKYLPNR